MPIICVLSILWLIWLRSSAFCPTRPDLLAAFPALCRPSCPATAHQQSPEHIHPRSPALSVCHSSPDQYPTVCHWSPDQCPPLARHFDHVTNCTAMSPMLIPLNGCPSWRRTRRAPVLVTDIPICQTRQSENSPATICQERPRGSPNRKSKSENRKSPKCRLPLGARKTPGTSGHGPTPWSSVSRYRCCPYGSPITWPFRWSWKQPTRRPAASYGFGNVASSARHKRTDYAQNDKRARNPASHPLPADSRLCVTVSHNNWQYPSLRVSGPGALGLSRLHSRSRRRTSIRHRCNALLRLKALSPRRHPMII